jgi:hypothetical protein
MKDLTETALRFTEMLELSPQKRDALLSAIDDPLVREQVRSLIDADRCAVRDGSMDLVD